MHPWVIPYLLTAFPHSKPASIIVSGLLHTFGLLDLLKAATLWLAANVTQDRRQSHVPRVFFSAYSQWETIEEDQIEQRFISGQSTIPRAVQYFHTIYAGASISSDRITSGTLGGFLKGLEDKLYGFTRGHVLPYQNNEVQCPSETLVQRFCERVESVLSVNRDQLGQLEEKLTLLGDEAEKVERVVARISGVNDEITTLLKQMEKVRTMPSVIGRVVATQVTEKKIERRECQDHTEKPLLKMEYIEHRVSDWAVFEYLGDEDDIHNSFYTQRLSFNGKRITPGLEVKKFGSVTGERWGKVCDVPSIFKDKDRAPAMAWAVQPSYSAQSFADVGDSGSVCSDNANNVQSVIFAGQKSGDIAYLMDMSDFLDDVRDGMGWTIMPQYL